MDDGVRWQNALWAKTSDISDLLHEYLNSESTSSCRFTAKFQVKERSLINIYICIHIYTYILYIYINKRSSHTHNSFILKQIVSCCRSKNHPAYNIQCILYMYARTHKCIWSQPFSPCLKQLLAFPLLPPFLA